ncbi:magnesium transporter [Algoriphagus ratkowskyi]|uniref:Magnesium transport protein CorA n=1 Tax=Algoriphagus ratkowskyi TaxID=57028 RepID=A0A2W7QZ87_9BACT|nr:CorA family divalent cation transporter [Algoriphagus ratkowskyi]PZX53863.1 magnesium transporter [Algoriphagus ratkowskyi]TXD76732.1 magnesium transporter [Algoriphagus ratkowskyi]
MIEILLANKKSFQAQSVSELTVSELDFHVMQFLDYGKSELSWLEENYGLDFTIMKHFEDIEISSHFLENEFQAAFHFSIPYYSKEKRMIEEPLFIIITQTGLFLFSSSNLDAYFNELYPAKIKSLQRIKDLKGIFNFQFEFISDYFADITESLSRKVKVLANKILVEKDFSSNVMDIITSYNFNNLLIKESLLETRRVLRLYMKSDWEQEVDLKESVRAELNDMLVISDYIQFNFDRLDDLKENVSNKIDLEQNHIFKMLTVVTVCISLPTLIAGVYGMNFESMPELTVDFGYPVVILAMICSAILPFIYFKRKKWL